MTRSTLTEHDSIDTAFDALAERFEPARIDRLREGVSRRMRGLTVVLDGLYDPGNRSSIYRTAEGFGLLDVHLVRPEAAWKEHARSVSRGAEKWIDLHTWRRPEDAVTHLRQAGFQLLVADAGARQGIADWDLSTPTALVFGNERDGVSPCLRAGAAGAFSMPMLGFAGSFNVSVAAALALQLARQQRERALGAVTDLDWDARRRLLVDYATRSSRWLQRAESESGRRVPGPWNLIDTPKDEP